MSRAFRKLKPVVHIYYGEATGRDKVCEQHYIQKVFGESLANISFEVYTKEHRFRAAAKKNKMQDDLFYAILDGDIDDNNQAATLRAKVEELKRFKNKGTGIKVILSNRCWEVWMSMFYQSVYTRACSNTVKYPLPIDYEKTRKWYWDNKDYLNQGLQGAIDAAKSSRKQVFKSEFNFNLNGWIESDFNQKMTENLLVKTPYTFMDIFCEEVIELNNK